MKRRQLLDMARVVRPRFPSILIAAMRSVRMRGGGLKGVLSLIRRSLSILRALGPKGFLKWLMGGAMRQSSSPPYSTGEIALITSDISDVSLRVGIMIHVYYADLLPEIREYLLGMPVPFLLMISVTEQQAEQDSLRLFDDLPNVSRLVVRKVPNRGRDISPLLVTFREELAQMDVFCHVHTKKSLHTGHENHEWRRYLFDALLGNSDRISWLLGTMHAMPDLGIIYPESYRSIPLSAHTWLGNWEIAQTLSRALSMQINPRDYIDFPAGSMFWARSSSLDALFGLNLTYQSFPEEAGQIDGTLHHAIERFFAELVKSKGQLVGVLPSDASLRMFASGSKNWSQYFSDNVSEKIGKNLTADGILTLDLFDTLILRRFLTPDGARDYLGHRALSLYGISDFPRIRQEAETILRSRLGADPSIQQIYSHIAKSVDDDGHTASSLMELEIALEASQLTVRRAVLSALERVSSGRLRYPCITDMYLPAHTLQRILPPEILDAVSSMYVSCETQLRKSEASSWPKLAERLGAQLETWTHVGDNEHSDIHCPSSAGVHRTIHIIRPDALLQSVPAFHSLSSAVKGHRSWQNDLAAGLIANRLTSLVDASPGTLGDTFQLQDAGSLGYLVLGPFLVDYLAWIHRIAKEHGFDKILFLAREGYLLKKGFDILNAAMSEDHRVDGTYFLASRRASGMASVRSVEDIVEILAPAFDGAVADMLRSRLGDKATDALISTGYVPFAASDESSISERLRRAADAAWDALAPLAETERQAYARYWEDTVGASVPLLADIGYSGTIQRNLSRLTQRRLAGAYFGLKEAARSVPGMLTARYHDARIDGPVQASPVFRFDLLLEAMLTAPHGQLSHFRSDMHAVTPTAIYINVPRDESRWQTIDTLQKGALQFIHDVTCTIGGDVVLMDLNKAIVQEPLSLVGRGIWKPEKWSQHLQVDDAYSGRGEVHPFSGIL